MVTCCLAELSVIEIASCFCELSENILTDVRTNYLFTFLENCEIVNKTLSSVPVLGLPFLCLLYDRSAVTKCYPLGGQKTRLKPLWFNFCCKITGQIFFSVFSFRHLAKQVFSDSGHPQFASLHENTKLKPMSDKICQFCPQIFVVQ